jgi:hypothetical protein
MFEKIVINSKDVFITEKHHHNLIPWALGRQKQKEGLIVLSLDHHLDTRDPFLHFAFEHTSLNYDKQKAAIELNKMDYNKINTIEEGISKLKNDEHITTAIQSGIIDKIFIISYNDSDDWPLSFEMKKYQNEVQKSIVNKLPDPSKPKRPYTYPDSKIYVVENMCSVGCNRRPHNDACLIPHFNQAIESILLNDKLDIIENMNSKIVNNRIFSKKFVLDIDLDYFHTCQSIHPVDSTTFNEIIKNSEFITITKEEEFVAEWINDYKYDEKLSVDYLINNLLDHIKVATM